MSMVLYNGELQEYDVSQHPGSGQILEGIHHRQEQIGQQYGDYVIVSSDYDWGTHREITIGRCVRCGAEKDVRNLATFKRGKGVGQICRCRYVKKPYVPPKSKYYDMAGEEHNGFKLLSYQPRKGFRTECVLCGKEKYASGKAVLEGRVTCNHRPTNDYSDPKWIGYRSGYLTFVSREDENCRFRCDCGREVLRRPKDVLRYKRIAACGDPNCLYQKKAHTENLDRRSEGLAYEYECAETLREQGFSVDMTPDTGDYGVDFFAVVDGERVAFQCKKLKQESVVSAVQQAYAGGRFYDCKRFVVVAPSGFTFNAEQMAAKLGVQLEMNVQKFQLRDLNENILAVSNFEPNLDRRTMWTIDGVSKLADEWCREYGISRGAVYVRMRQKGVDLKTALMSAKYGRDVSGIEIDGVVKSKPDWCAEYGISPQLYDYRVKYAGLSPMEALTKPKQR